MTHFGFQTHQSPPLLPFPTSIALKSKGDWAASPHPLPPTLLPSHPSKTKHRDDPLWIPNQPVSTSIHTPKQGGLGSIPPPLPPTLLPPPPHPKQSTDMTHYEFQTYLSPLLLLSPTSTSTPKQGGLGNSPLLPPPHPFLSFPQTKYRGDPLWTPNLPVATAASIPTSIPWQRGLGSVPLCWLASGRWKLRHLLVVVSVAATALAVGRSVIFQTNCQHRVTAWLRFTKQKLTLGSHITVPNSRSALTGTNTALSEQQASIHVLKSVDKYAFLQASKIRNVFILWIKRYFHTPQKGTS